jgi:epothilone polyketide synthase D
MNPFSTDSQDTALPAGLPIGRPDREPVAIIGIGCQFPGGVEDPRSFWKLLINGATAIEEIPPSRMDLETYFDPRPATPGKLMSRWGGFLKDIDRFDAAFFRIAPREADRLDPQQRLLLEVSLEALEDAGLPPASLSGSRTGVFVGQWLNDYEGRMFVDPAQADFYMTTGSGRYAASGRISFTFGLRGPSITVDTACSSSLVAVHLACQSLWSGESSLAIAGGVNVLLQPHITIAYSQSRMMAPDGRCKFGDAKGDGYVRSEGAAAIVLKPYRQALADGDPIYAVILGSAVNNDGDTSGYLATPAQEGQAEMLRTAYREAAVSPGLVQYVEAHGTGTLAGDPVEIGALAQVLAQDRPADQPCFVGSVKTNFGHTEGAAGLAGLIKATLALQHRIIPASLNLEELNPKIDWAHIPIRIPRQATPWPATSGGLSLVAGVSAFGIAGTNAHVVLAAPPVHARPATPAAQPVLLPLSAHSEAALRQRASALIAHLQSAEAPALPDLAYTLSARREHYDSRLAVAGAALQEIIDALGAYLAGQASPALAARALEGGPAHKVVFLFPGQGSQYVGMGRDLMVRFPVFRAALEACEAALQPYVDWSLLEQLRLAPDDPAYRLEHIDVIQPVLLAIEIALARLWQSWGVQPQAVIGHSMGEAAAAYIAGAISLEDAMRVIAHRSRLMRRTSGQGAMAVAELSIEEAQAALGEYQERLSVAVSNAPRSVVLSGDPQALDQVLARLQAKEVFCRKVKVDVASHSPQMAPLMEELGAALHGLAPRPAAMAVYSTVDGALIPGEACDAAYWVRNLRQPVQFSRMVQQALADGCDLFIEMSPHPILLHAVQQGMQHAGRAGITLASTRRDQPESAAILASLGQCYTLGLPLAWEQVSPPGQVVPLPVYPFQRERFWWEPPVDRGRRSRTARGGHPILGEPLRLATGEYSWEFDLSLEQFPFLKDHRVRGAAILPAAAFAELALSAASQAFQASRLRLEQMAFKEALTLTETDAHSLQLLMAPDFPGSLAFQFYSRPAGSPDAAWRLHASGAARVSGDAPLPSEAPGSPLGSAAEADAFYPAMASFGLEYGPAFQGVVSFRRDEAGLQAALKSPSAWSETGAFRLPPPLLDAVFQTAVGLLAGEQLQPGETPLPVGLERLEVDFEALAQSGEAALTTVSTRHPQAADLRADLRLFDPAGRCLLRAEGLAFQRLESAARAAPPDDWYHTLRWEPLPPAEPPARIPARWLIFADAGGVGARLAEALGRAGAQSSLALRGERFLESAPGVYQLNPANPADFASLLARLGAQAAPLERVIYLWGLDSRQAGRPPAEAGASTQAVETDLLAAAALLQSLARQERARPAGFAVTLVSRGAQPADPAQALVEPAGATLWGLQRVATLEHPELRCASLDLDPAAPPGEIEGLLRELLADDSEDQIALRGPDGRQRFAARLVPLAPAEETAAPLDRLAAYYQSARLPFQVTSGRPGILDQLTALPLARARPAAGQVEIEVQAVGLNFMNVMAALGAYPGYPQGRGPLGIECAGRISAIGEGVDRFQVGDQVVAVAFDCLATYAITDARLVAPKPPALSLSQAATLPIVYLTAYYGLLELGRLQPGERVLIHAGAGGVGLAAIQLARRQGAEIFATAGSPEKRAFLEQLGVPHVMDSRSLAFAEDVLRITGGEGVDLVLNSLAGEAVEKGLSILRPYGRFIEIGKRDIYENSRLGLLPFQRNLAYFAVDLDRMSRERPERVGKMLGELMTLAARGEITPLPETVYPVSQAVEAFRSMAQARHIGKIVLDFQAQPGSAPPPAGFQVRPDVTYLITGGLGGLGLETAAWLARSGARSLALIGRRAPDEAAAKAIQALQAGGVQVMIASLDVADEHALSSLLAEIQANRPPLGGVFHAAGLLDDGLLLALTPEQFRRVLRPKLHGAWNLHRLTQGLPLDCFVLFSSATALLGTPGQANYAAANAYLDALAHHRRALGLPALAINWGPWSQVGLAAAQSQRGERLAQRGLGSITPQQGIAAMQRLLRQPSGAQAAVMPFDLDEWAAFYPPAAHAALFKNLAALRPEGEPGTSPAAAPSADSPAALRQQLLSAEAGRQRRGLFEQHLRQQVAAVLRLAAERIPLNKPLKTLGLDSLMTLELRNRLEASLGMSVSATFVFNYPTIALLAPYLAEKLEIPLEAAEAAPQPADEPPAAGAVEDLSKEEIEALLADELAAVDDLLGGKESKDKPR